MDRNKEWMMSGKVGCTFATLFARNPESILWKTITIGSVEEVRDGEMFRIPEDASILSIQFPGCRREDVLGWASRNGFYEEDNGDGCIGLRYRVYDGLQPLVSWVQYFGPDAHVPTRKAPVPELMMCVRLPVKYYAKVGFKGILHLAHASVSSITDYMADKLWDSSFLNTKKRIGHKPTLREAAKTTYIK